MEMTKEIETRFEEIGFAAIKLLNLKVKKNGRVDTAYGDKTPLGIGATIVDFIAEERSKS